MKRTIILTLALSIFGIVFYAGDLASQKEVESIPPVLKETHLKQLMVRLTSNGCDVLRNNLVNPGQVDVNIISYTANMTYKNSNHICKVKLECGHEIVMTVYAANTAEERSAKRGICETARAAFVSNRKIKIDHDGYGFSSPQAVIFSRFSLNEITILPK